MQIDFRDRPVENEFDRMFDYDADGVLNPLEQSYKLDFMTGHIEGYEDEDEDSYDSDYYYDDDDDDDCGYCMSDTERKKWDETLNQLKEAHERREAKKVLIICGILIVSSIIFASSPGIILFIGAMILSAKIGKMF